MLKPDQSTRSKVLLTPQELHALCAGAQPPVILAAQSINPYTGVPSQSGRWIPGAVDVDVYRDFAAPASAAQGQRPLPCVKDLQAAAQRWGVRQDRPVVVYDPDRAMTAARAWWTLRWAGVRDVRVLDGGLHAWIAAGYETANNAGNSEPSQVELSAGHMPELTADTALHLAQAGCLLDARIRPNYIGGAAVGGDPRRGHIPGAISAPAPDNFMDEGTITDAATLAEMYRGFGATRGDPVGAYCGAGMSAAVTVLALASIGVEAALYPGSWSQWVNDPSRPVRRGPFP